MVPVVVAVMRLTNMLVLEIAFISIFMRMSFSNFFSREYLSPFMDIKTVLINFFSCLFLHAERRKSKILKIQHMQDSQRIVV